MLKYEKEKKFNGTSEGEEKGVTTIFMAILQLDRTKTISLKHDKIFHFSR